MKKVIVSKISFFILLLIIINMYGCQSDKSPYIEEAQALTTYLSKTNHIIRKMKNKTSMQQNVNASNFFIFSSISIKNTDQSVVLFSFLDSISQTYSMISVPLSKVKISFSNDSIPSVKFVLKESLLYKFLLCRYENTLYSNGFEGRTGYISPNEVFIKKQQSIFNEYLSYMIINCRENDWPTNIELPFDEVE